jgi:hypothetical protein
MGNPQHADNRPREDGDAFRRTWELWAAAYRRLVSRTGVWAHVLHDVRRLRKRLLDASVNHGATCRKLREAEQDIIRETRPPAPKRKRKGTATAKRRKSPGKKNYAGGGQGPIVNTGQTRKRGSHRGPY